MNGGAGLTLNAGSSSLKFALFTPDRQPRKLLSGKIERIGLPQAMMSVYGAETESKFFPVVAPDHASAARALCGPLSHLALPSAVAIGHRVVHGGAHYQIP